MRANRMNGPVTAPTDSAYATLARLKIALPLTQAAVLSDSGNSESTVITLIDLTRELTDRLAEASFARLQQLDVERRERLLRSLAQEVAYLIGRSHERGEQIDAARLITNVQHAMSAIDAVPGARTSQFFTETLEQKTEWELAVTRAASRIAESLIDAPEMARHVHAFLALLLERVEISAKEIEAQRDEARRTVRLSLLTQFSKSHARIIARGTTLELAGGRKVDVAALLGKIDVYHSTLAKAVAALTSRGITPVAEHSSFTPEI